MKRNSVWGIALKAGTIQTTQVFGSRQEAEDAIAKISHLSNGFEAVELGPVNSPELPDGWIKCSERMPAKSGRYFVWIEDHNGRPCYADIVTWHDDAVGFRAGGAVNFWMPLPAPPTTEK